MRIETIQLSSFKDASYNPRLDLQPGQPAYEKLNRSIIDFGFLQPIVVNEQTRHIISGHQRAKILRRQGITEIQAVIVNFSLEKEKAANLALNKLSGGWDLEKLAQLLSELQAMPDFDMLSTGFDVAEVSEIVDRLVQEKDGDDFDFQADVDSIGEPVTKRGDIIELGQHRILCGDSSNPQDIALLMGNEKADIVDCDYPYNVNYGGGAKPNSNTRPKDSRKWRQIYSDNMPQQEYEIWMKKVLVNIREYLKPGAAFYIWQGLRQIPPLCQMLIDLGFHLSCIICWLKESAAITYADYSYRTEQALYGWLEGAPHYWAGKPGTSNVWEVKRDATKSYLHPTQKPVELAQRALQNSSKIGDIVLDTFLGSGSLLIGAESLGRRCYGLELDPRYVDAIVRRYIAFVGKDKVPASLVAKYGKEDQHASK